MIEYLYLGRIGYTEALALQEEIVSLRQRGLVDNVLLLLEHPPVLTLGRNAHRSNILASDEFLAQRGVTVHEINRGGDVTYHGPGQLVGYPIFDLRSLHNDSGGRLGPVDYVRRMEEALIRLCGQYGLPTFRIPGLTGVWCDPAGGKILDESCGAASNNLANGRAPACAEPVHNKDNPQGEKKIAAIGVHVARGVTSHGFAFNLTTNLDDFQLIIPCGIADHAVASLEREVAGPLPSLEEFAHQAARHFGLVFGEQVLAIENMDVLRQQARKAEERQKYPAEDTAALPPEDLARLRQPGGGPVSA